MNSIGANCTAGKLYLTAPGALTNSPNTLAHNTITGEISTVPLGQWIDISSTLQLNNISVGAGTIEAFYTRNGQTMTGYMVLTLGTGFSIGATPNFILPFPMSNAREANGWTGGVFDASTTTEYVMSGYGISTTQIGFRHHELSGVRNISKVSISASDPIVFAIGDKISMIGTYKVANGF